MDGGWEGEKKEEKKEKFHFWLESKGNANADVMIM